MAVRYIPTGAATSNLNGNVGIAIAKLVHDEPVTIQLTSVDDNTALRGVVFSSALAINRVLFKLKNIGQGAGTWLLYGCNNFDQYPNHTLTQLLFAPLRTGYEITPSGGFGQEWVVWDFANTTPFKWYFIAHYGSDTPIQTATVTAWEFWNTLDVPVVIGGGDTVVNPGTVIPNNTLETQSYSNLGGSGLRAGPIPVSNSAAFDAAYRSSIFTLDHNYPAANGVHVMYLMLDGYKPTNGIYAWAPNGNSTGNSVVGNWFKFSLRGRSRKITKASLYFAQTSGNGFGSHKWQGSNDNTTWLDLTLETVVVAPASGPQEFIFDRNVGYYKHYRMIGVSGNAGGPTYIGEVEFEISGVPYERGDRRADITVSSNIAPTTGSWSLLFDDLFTSYNPVGAPAWGTSISATGKFVAWSFPRPVLLSAIFWQSGGGSTITAPLTTYVDLGLWDLYGSNNNYDWHTLVGGINRQIYGDVLVDLSALKEPYQFYKLVPQGPNLLHTINNFDDNVLAEFQFDIAAQYAALDLKEPLVPVTQSYNNLGGVGQRSDRHNTATAGAIGLPFDIATNITPYSASYFVSKLFDGVDTVNATTRAFSWAAQTVAGKYIQITWRGLPRIIDGFTWKQSTTASHGIWRFEGSDDGVTWVSLSGDFTLGGVATQVVAFVNTHAYASYRLAGVSGNTSTAPFLNEMTFKTSGLPFEHGDRRNDITATTTVPSHASYSAASYPFTSLIDGDPATNKWRPQAGQNVAGLEMRFVFPYKVRVVKLYWLCDDGSLDAKAMGTWQPQGSDDGTTWTNLGATIAFTHAGASWFAIGDTADGKPFKVFRLLGVSGITETGAYATGACYLIDFDIYPAAASPFEVTFTDESAISIEKPVLSLNLQTRFYDEGQLTLDADALVIGAGTGTFFAVTFTDESQLSVTPTIVGGASNGAPANVQMIINRS